MAGILLFIISTSLLSAFEETIITGREDNWGSLVMLDGVELKPGWEGYPDIMLTDGEYTLPAESSGFLFHFNGPWEPDLDPSCVLENNERNYSVREKVLGEASLAFQAGEAPLILHPGEGSFLSKGQNIEDFTIEFWLYPARLSEGEGVFFWEGGWWDEGDFLAQGISCMVAGQKLLWNFSNFFLPPGGAETKFILQGDTILLPRRWHHHLIRYDSLSGLLEYLVDDRPEAVIYTTPTGHEFPEIYLPVSGALADTRIQLGTGFIGLMDELRISDVRVEEPQLERYFRRQGAAVTRVFDLEQSETEIIAVNVKESVPGNSDIYHFYRISDSLFAPDDPDLPWQEFTGSESHGWSGSFQGVTGRYIQLRVELLPDGTGSMSPAVSSMEIVYQSKLPPLPPAYVIARPGDGEVLLKWNAMTNAKSRGFRVFYGEKPGFYFGTSTDPATGHSPIDAGNSTELLIKGLENGKLYYFAVMAYTGTFGDLTSEFSREVSARPSPLHRIE